MQALAPVHSFQIAPTQMQHPPEWSTFILPCIASGGFRTHVRKTLKKRFIVKQNTSTDGYFIYFANITWEPTPGQQCTGTEIHAWFYSKSISQIKFNCLTTSQDLFFSGNSQQLFALGWICKWTWIFLLDVYLYRGMVPVTSEHGGLGVTSADLRNMWPLTIVSCCGWPWWCLYFDVNSDFQGGVLWKED